MFGWLRQRPLLDADVSDWIFATFDWALRNFGTDVFRDKTLLVQPSDRHFPDRIGSPGELAQKIFARVQAFSAMET